MYTIDGSKIGGNHLLNVFAPTEVIIKVIANIISEVFAPRICVKLMFRSTEFSVHLYVETEWWPIDLRYAIPN